MQTQSLASPLWHPQCSTVPHMYSGYLTVLPHETELGLPLLIFSRVPQAQASGSPQGLPTLPPFLAFVVVCLLAGRLSPVGKTF